ncbi:hypothetical protein HPB50_016552 [Hyalomma asiaticum]|uniref:Uncharacterized protein n=1 Tax=Hyalomma asiaticum TaxID=266040 RepID=A0ACB7SX01_HYAAI|nr:hypothetical protein HPB50_016552 [Hyalomma asiaticum]
MGSRSALVTEALTSKTERVLMLRIAQTAATTKYTRSKTTHAKIGSRCGLKVAQEPMQPLRQRLYYVTCLSRSPRRRRKREVEMKRKKKKKTAQKEENDEMQGLSSLPPASKYAHGIQSSPASSYDSQ